MTIEPLLSETHPIWRTINVAVIGALVLGAMKLHAENFDDEWFAWVEIVAGLAGLEVGKNWVAKKLKAEAGSFCGPGEGPCTLPPEDDNS